MNNNTTAPTYTLRGLQLIGWRDMQHALDYLFADGQLKQGTLVAINAEKMLTIEDNAEVRELINAAEFKYADGISVVRSVRKKYPQAKKGHRYFLWAVNLKCWRKLKLNCATSGM